MGPAQAIISLLEVEHGACQAELSPSNLSAVWRSITWQGAMMSCASVQTATAALGATCAGDGSFSWSGLKLYMDTVVLTSATSHCPATILQICMMLRAMTASVLRLVLSAW